MTSDLDIYRAAQSLIEGQGDDAPIQGGMRADALLHQGDMEGGVWKRILMAVDEQPDLT